MNHLLRRIPSGAIGRTALAIGAMLVSLTAPPKPVAAQIEISGQLDLLASVARDTLGINANFRRDNPFSPVRLKIFARSWVTENIGIFAEFLYDIDASPRLNGAYAVINEIAGRPWFNARVGLAPSLIGGFGLRATYFNSNPLVGVPLIWQYRTNLDGGGTSTAATIGAGAGEPGRGVPMLYEGCWNVQWELLGEVGNFEYSLGMTPGSLSNPERSRVVPGVGFLGRMGYVPLPGLRLGLSAARGPYLSAPSPDGNGDLPYLDDPSSFDQALLGLDVEYGSGPWLLHSEVYRESWETPLISEDLDVVGGFAELRFDFRAGWYLAGRAGGMLFGDITIDSATGTRSPWDNDTRRVEAAVGYRLSREVLLKLDWQRTSWAGDFPAQNQLAVQLSSVF